MNERGTAVLEKYDLKTIRTSRARGAVLCETDKGLKLLKEYRGTEGRLVFQTEVLSQLSNTGIVEVDKFVLNKDKGVIVIDNDRTKYTLRNWYSGREPDIRSPKEAEECAILLGKLHRAMNDVKPKMETTVKKQDNNALITEFKKHTNEIKRTRSFIQSKRRKQDFELKVMLRYEEFYEDAMKVMRLLNDEKYKNAIAWANENSSIIHGNFNQHNVIIHSNSMAVVNFERARIDMQVKDLYHYLRKVMEKNNWNMELGYSIINAYSSEKPLTQEELKVLYLLILYPEKFWKIINYYFNSNKAWISDKNSEKLNNICNQREVKEKFALFLETNMIR